MPRPPVLITKREMVWIPAAPSEREISKFCRARIEGRAYRVWTLRGEGMDDPARRPALEGFIPRHNANAFMEDHLHDWRQDGDTLVYYSRVTSGGVWVLVEFSERGRL